MSHRHTLTILLVDDQALLRLGVRTVLEAVPGLEVVGEAAVGQAAVELARLRRPGLIITELRLPDMDGGALIRLVRHESPNTMFLVLSHNPDETLLLEALRAGAAGFLRKHTSPSALVEAVRTMATGQPALDPIATRLLLNDAQQAPGGAESLTAREMEVLCLVARGQTNQDIARQLVISERTVRTHFSRVLDKLGLDNRTQAALYALRHGWVSGE